MTTTETHREQTGPVVRPVAGSGLPQVNLLPPEVRSARGLRVIQRWLVIALIVVAVICVGLVGWAMLNKSNAQDELEQAQQRTAELTAEVATYAEVPQVEASLDRAWSAQVLGMSSDVLWAERVGAIAALLPNDMKIESFDVVMPSVTDPTLTTENPLRPLPSGTVALVLRSTTIPDTATLMASLDAVPGFTSAWTDSLETAQDDADGAVFYRVKMSVLVTQDALSGRFDRPDATTTEGEG
jgi:type II secretory pathway pseudopilin PulG